MFGNSGLLDKSHFLRMLNRFEKAVRAHEFRGSQHPQDQLTIEQEYHGARTALVNYVTRKQP